MSQNREQWGSKLGFILAASGSAVGIGNIWKYPSMAGQNGGGAFTIIYLACILIVGLSIVVAEFVIGRKTQLSPVGAFEQLAPNTNWKWVGLLGVAAAFVILSIYGVVGQNLNIYKNVENKSIFYSLEINSDQKKNVVSRDSKGDPKIFEIQILIDLTILENNKIKNKKNFKESFTYNNSTNKFSLKQYEENIEENLIEKIVEKIIIYLHSI